MTKTLTEQWKNGELPREFYYIRDRRKEVYLSCLIDYKTEKGWVKEVLAPVPSYDEIKRLQEQLKEANEVIDNFRTYDFTVNDEVAEEYQVKWGVKAKRLYRHRKRGVK